MADKPAPQSAQTPGPWVTWYEYDEDGFITAAGVDNADRSVNICVTTCENVIDGESDETPDKFNAVVKADTELLGAAAEMLAVLRSVEEMFDVMTKYGHFDRLADDMHPVEINVTCDAVANVIAKATGEAVAP